MHGIDNLDAIKLIEDYLARHIGQYHKEKSSRFIPPSPQEVTDYAASIGFKLDGEYFCDHYETNGWVRGKTKMKDWRRAVKTWKHNKAETTVDSQICIVDHRTGFRYQLNQKGKKVWLCEECRKAFGSGSWGFLSPPDLERIILANKTKGQVRAITKFEEPEEYYE